MRNREEHLAWCKQVALEYLDAGDIGEAIVAMISHMNEHEETKLSNPTLVLLATMYARDGDYAGARRWIEGWR
jgi:hypothetical protein